MPTEVLMLQINCTGKSKASVHYIAVKRVNPEEDIKDKEENALCGLVFVNRPHTALALNKLLQELCNWDSDLFFLQSHHLTWSDSLLASSLHKQSKETTMMHRRQEVRLFMQLMKKFLHHYLHLELSF